MGKCAEEFVVGEVSISAGRTVTETDVVQYSWISGDTNPMHTDAEYSARSPVGQRIAHGTLGMSICTGLSARMGQFDGTAIAALGVDDWQFLHPIFIGDTVYLRTTVLSARVSSSKPDRGVVVRQMELLNQNEDHPTRPDENHGLQLGRARSGPLRPEHHHHHHHHRICQRRSTPMTTATTRPGGLVNTTGLTDEQLMMRESVLDILQATLPLDSIRDLDEKRQFPEEAYQALASSGFLAIPFDEEFGGAGGSYKDLTVFMEALGYHYSGIGQGVMTTLIYAGGHVAKFGSDELKRRILPQIIEGKVKLALAMSEPGTGSDVAGLKTKAVRQGDGYVLYGAKVWITCAHVADYIVVIAKTDPSAPRHQGLSTFLVDTKAAGVTINPLSMLGRRTTHANEVVLDNVFVPEENLHR